MSIRQDYIVVGLQLPYDVQQNYTPYEHAQKEYRHIAHISRFIHQFRFFIHNITLKHYTRQSISKIIPFAKGFLVSIFICNFDGLKAIMNYAVSKRYIEKSPLENYTYIRKLDTRTKKRALSFPEITQIMRYYADTYG